jgi:hypothetical protein
VKLSNDYYNKYMSKRYAERRLFAINKLGGVCVECGSKKNLEFDHIDRSTKSFSMADCMLWAKERFLRELDKCQLLCKSCHQKKTLVDLNQTDGRNSHGTLSSYKYCRCDICKKAQREYNKKYQLEHKEALEIKKQIKQAKRLRTSIG